MVSIFPMINAADKFEWFKKQRTVYSNEYSWIIEAGDMKNTSFITNGVFLGFSVGTANLESKNPKSGSIDEMIKDGGGSIYYSDRMKNEIISPASRSIEAIRDNNSIVIFTRSKEDINFLLQDKPKYARMTYSSLDKKSNYSCISPIDK